MRTILLVLTLGGLFIAAVASAAYMWWRLAGVEIGPHGLIALLLGSALSLALGGGLMALVFYSSRSGHDERQNRRWD